MKVSSASTASSAVQRQTLGVVRSAAYAATALALVGLSAGAQGWMVGPFTKPAGVNPIIRVNEVTVNLGFSLADNTGRMISDATAQGGSFSGSDIRSAAARLINEQADEVVATLYSDYCTKGVAPKPVAEPKRKK